MDYYDRIQEQILAKIYPIPIPSSFSFIPSKVKNQNID
jgi:hypothetical protein